VLQDINQLVAMYGPHGARTFIANSGGMFAFAANDDNTAEFLSSFADNQSILGMSASDDPQTGKARINYSRANERVWSPGDIRSLLRFHGLVWKAGQSKPQPVIAPPYWDIAKCRGLAQPDPYHPKSKPGPRSKAVAAVLAIGAIVAGLWLWWPSNPPAHAQPSPVVRVDPPKANPPASSKKHHVERR
jgi:type IV secretory pathway TraG/TraD family ATPase VirD4